MCIEDPTLPVDAIGEAKKIAGEKRTGGDLRWVPGSSTSNESVVIEYTKSLLKSGSIPDHHRDLIMFNYNQILGLRNVAWT